MMESKSTDEFTLSRLIDYNYPPNRLLLFVLLIVLISSLAWFFYSNNSILQSIFFALIQTIIVFLCWAIGRELDPDHDYAAFFGLILLFLPFTLLKGNVFLLIWFLMSLRIVNHTTGKNTSSSDISLYVFITLIAALITTNIIIIPLSIIIIILTAILPKQQLNLTLLSIPLIPSLILLSLIFTDAWSILDPSPFILIFIALSSALMFLVTITTDTIQCLGDYSNQPLSLKRVQSTQIIAVLSILLITTFHGSFFSVFPIWAAIIGIGVFRLIYLLYNR